MGSILRFFFLTYLVSWGCWFAVVAMNRSAQTQPGPMGAALVLAGTLAPAMAALASTAFSAGRQGLSAILSSLFEGGVGIRWYLFAILYMPAVKGLVVLSHLLITGRWPRFGQEGPFVIAVAILISTPVQAGEEIGWRGYALPRIASRIGLGPASIVVGILWGVWHLPLFYLPGADKYGQSFPLYVAGVMAFSVALAWLYGKTGGSLLLMMLMHSAFNQTIGVVPDVLRPGERPFALGASLSFLLTLGWMWLAAGILLTRMPAAPPVPEPAHREAYSQAGG